MVLKATGAFTTLMNSIGLSYAGLCREFGGISSSAFSEQSNVGPWQAARSGGERYSSQDAQIVLL